MLRLLTFGLLVALAGCSDRVTVRYTDCTFLRENGQADSNFVSQLTFMVAPKTQEVFDVGMTTTNLARCGAADFGSCLRSCSVADVLHWSCREKSRRSGHGRRARLARNVQRRWR